MAALLLLLAACGSGGSPEAAPTFSLDDVRNPGTRVTLPDGEPVIVNFLASWCGPCREELPELERISEKIAVVGVDVADNRGKAVELLDEAGVTFPVGYDPQREVASGYRVNGMPTTVLVGADGTERERVQGPVTRATLEGWADPG